MTKVTLLVGHVLDKLRELPDESVHCVVTSPPYYGLRDYGIEPQVWPDGWRGSLGLEPTPALYIEHMVTVFREVKRVLRRDGCCFINIGDSYCAGTSAKRKAPKTKVDVGGWLDSEIDGGARINAPGIKPKDLLGVPWMLAFALRDDGWWLRSEIIWAKKAPMPESCTDRPTSAHEKVFLLTKASRYYFDMDAVREPQETADPSNPGYRAIVQPGLGSPNGSDKNGARREAGHGVKPPPAIKVLDPRGRNLRNFWLLGPEPFPEAHFATFPTEIPRRAILAGTSERGVCPKCGAGWKRVVEKSGGTTGKGGDWSKGEGYDRQSRGQVGGTDLRAGWENGYSVETISWRSTCKCDAGEPVPATVLDPFFGSGTTGVVAQRLWRDCIGIDLSAEYAEMARRRSPDGLLNQMEVVP